MQILRPVDRWRNTSVVACSFRLQSRKSRRRSWQGNSVSWFCRLVLCQIWFQTIKAERTLRRKQIATLQHFCLESNDKSRFQAVNALFWQVRKYSGPCWSKYWPAFFTSQICTLSRSKISTVPPVPCECKVEPCKVLSVKKFVRTSIKRSSPRAIKLASYSSGVLCDAVFALSLCFCCRHVDFQ